MMNAPVKTSIRGVIFDLFHTLTGKESEWSDLPWTSDVLGIDRRLWDELLTSRSRWRLTGEERDPLKILTTLAREADPAISDERIQEALRVRVQRFRATLQRIPLENIDVLEGLRASGLRLGLISNADVMEVEAWHDCPLAGLFDAEVFSCEIGCVKPEPAIYEHCLQALGVSASECLFVGDDLEVNEFALDEERCPSESMAHAISVVNGRLERLRSKRHIRQHLLAIG